VVGSLIQKITEFIYLFVVGARWVECFYELTFGFGLLHLLFEIVKARGGVVDGRQLELLEGLFGYCTIVMD